MNTRLVWFLTVFIIFSQLAFLSFAWRVGYLQGKQVGRQEVRSDMLLEAELSKFGAKKEGLNEY